MPYQLEFLSSAEREFLSLSVEIQRRIDPHILALASTPRPSRVKRLKGHENLWRLRVGNYRVVYEIDDDRRKIVVTRVRPRATVYRGL